MTKPWETRPKRRPDLAMLVIAAVMALFIMLVAFIIASVASAQEYPNPIWTPGVTDPAATVCAPGYAMKARHVTLAMKRYGLDPKDLGLHYLSLEIGGANLWPQRWKPEPGARAKDVVENALHRWICRGKITQLDAVKIILDDWYKCYKTIKSGKVCEVPSGQ